MTNCYKISVEVKDNVVECLNSTENEMHEYYYDDLLLDLLKEVQDIKYKNFVIYADSNPSTKENLLHVEILDKDFIDWEDSTKWNKFIQLCNQEKEDIINLINTEIIDILNKKCNTTKLAQFPTNCNFMYNTRHKTFYIEFNPTSTKEIETTQLKFEYIDDIDFENF